MGSCWRARNMMRGLFLLLLHATGLFGASLLDEMEVVAQDCRTHSCDAEEKTLFAYSFSPAPKPIRLPWKEGEKIPKGWTREWVEADCPNPPCRAAGGWVLTRISSLGGTSVISSPRVLSAPSSDEAQSSDCPALHCKRPSLKNRGMICCPLISGHRGRARSGRARSGRPRSGRPRCPRSCD